MPAGSILINTSRGGLVDTRALIHALKDKHLAGAGLDVYEAEAGVFYRDLSMDVLRDDQLARLLSFNNVLVTCHQGYFTEEAMQRIATSTFDNVKAHFAKQS
jgi:D-lactate dehydrogenase